MYAAGGDSLLQWGFFAFLALIVFRELYVGFKSGLSLMVRRFIALGLAYLAAMILRDSVSESLRYLGMPLLFANVAGGPVAGVLAFCALLRLLKPPVMVVAETIEEVDAETTSTSGTDASCSITGWSRAVGASLGTAFGAVVAWVVLQAVLLGGTLFQEFGPEGTTHAAGTPSQPPSVATQPSPQPNVSAATPVPTSPTTLPEASMAPRPSAPASLPGWARGLVALKDSLRGGSAASMVRSVDAVDPSVYRVLWKLGQMISRPEAIDRFSKCPTVSHLLKNQQLERLVANPEITGKIERNELTGLLWDPRLLALANDPAIARELAGFELEHALDFALAAPTPREADPKWVSER